ncbi:hypothetical protein Tco_0803890 [Tanacetum coccineum]|uniref:Uncharacterized protein n=1 Tax=Tanacetum coccineum TaxID=301880 RepID=A0ABQ5A6M5_9ASTR
MDELEYFFEEVYKETTEKLDWNNPEGQQYPHDLRKPLPLIPNFGWSVNAITVCITSSTTTLAYLCLGYACDVYYNVEPLHVNVRFRSVRMANGLINTLDWNHRSLEPDVMLFHQREARLFNMVPFAFKHRTNRLILLVLGKMTNLECLEESSSF